MGLFEVILFTALIVAAGTLCLLLIEIDRRIRAWLDYGVVHRQGAGVIDNSELIQVMKREEDRCIYHIRV